MASVRERTALLFEASKRFQIPRPKTVSIWIWNRHLQQLVETFVPVVSQGTAVTVRPLDLQAEGSEETQSIIRPASGDEYDLGEAVHDRFFGFHHRQRVIVEIRQRNTGLVCKISGSAQDRQGREISRLASYCLYESFPCRHDALLSEFSGTGPGRFCLSDPCMSTAAV